MLVAVEAISEWAVDTGVPDLGPFGPVITEPPPGEPPTWPPRPGAPTSSNPGPLPSILRVPEIEAGIIARNVGIAATVAATAAEWCARRMVASGLSPFRLCQRLPLFFSGRDVAEATDHDIEALIPRSGNSLWVRLTYKPAGTKTQWYNSFPQTGTEELCAAPNDPSLSCDEYPFWATEQGESNARPLPHLKLISHSDNTDQGGLYGNFVTACRMARRLPNALGYDRRHGSGQFPSHPTAARHGARHFPSL